MEFTRGFYWGEEVDCERFRKLYAQKIHGLVPTMLADKMDEHQRQCKLCGAWVKINAARIVEE